MPQKIHAWNLPAGQAGTRNRPTVGRFNTLAELGARPIQAEPVQILPFVATLCMPWTAFRHRFRHPNVTELGTGVSE
jgi:hypothetical protein